MPFSVVGVAGNITRPSRTAALLSAVLSEIGSLRHVRSRLVELVDIGPELFQSITPDRFESFSSFAAQRLSSHVRSVIRAIETADALVVGTPVYKASYSGALKHLFDLIPANALTGKPVLLAATAGSPLHGLVAEHQLRPLFGFFNTLTLPTTIFAPESDFQNHRIEKPELLARINRAATEFVELVELVEAQSTRQRAAAALATA
jgi:FMN reductase